MNFVCDKINRNNCTIVNLSCMVVGAMVKDLTIKNSMHKDFDDELTDMMTVLVPICSLPLPETNQTLNLRKKKRGRKGRMEKCIALAQRGQSFDFQRGCNAWEKCDEN